MSPSVAAKFTAPGFTYGKALGRSVGYKGVACSILVCGSQQSWIYHQRRLWFYHRSDGCRRRRLDHESARTAATTSRHIVTPGCCWRSSRFSTRDFSLLRISSRLETEESGATLSCMKILEIKSLRTGLRFYVPRRHWGKRLRLVSHQ